LIVAATIHLPVLCNRDPVLRGNRQIAAVGLDRPVVSGQSSWSNIYRHLAEPPTPLRQRIIGGARRATRLPGKLVEIFASASEVNQAIVFSAAIIIAGFVPLFTMSGVEGHIFAPMAKTYAYAIAGGLIATFTISPALSAILLPERVSEVETFLVRGLRRLYRPVLEFALANRIVTLGGAALLLALAAIAALARSGVPAQARRRKPVDPRNPPALGLARGGERLCQPNAPRHQELSGGGNGHLAKRTTR
jgi:cobalt-zinc-cadmium resistance protein CzcA